MGKKRSLKKKVWTPIIVDNTAERAERRVKRLKKLDPDPEADTRLKKCHQDQILKLLVPSYRLAIAQDQINAYFNHASLIWFLRFPDAEAEVHVHKAFLGDTEYETHIRNQRIKWLKTKLQWVAFRVPAKGGRSGSKLSSWDKELNLVIQKIAEDLPTPWDPADCEGLSGTYHFYDKTWAFACTVFSIPPTISFLPTTFFISPWQ
ncbi:uncharacterized protein LACBIDRAFT_335965 [Laccaria bicolor S238N-H82]|uniref:Predicted protein n=1 Tax=Laccaria bicolor (strain S238N-H82 / ATCC MYA-4686) TaxID=486041 RepID=B0E3Z4_LACBS|nr:uncharacterized protein LACBIDRAFT_335965 [Laccaria bicolor S238N-H82]EDQ98437.1 predicted protein [Laccaria bicolor S238N-H82]|eukprot:XP_001890911.1 predicted protein [Laccaria bicolor S238N-H82]